LVREWLPSGASSKNLRTRVFSGSTGGEQRPPLQQLPKVVQLVNRAEAWRALLASGKEPSRAALAHRFKCTRARITQVMKLLDLHPAVLAYLRRLPPGTPTNRVTERGLRQIVDLPRMEQVAAARRLVWGFDEHLRGAAS
jgi:hypothetical protein